MQTETSSRDNAAANSKSKKDTGTTTLRTGIGAMALGLVCAMNASTAQAQQSEQVFVSNISQSLNYYAGLRRSDYVLTEFRPGRAPSYRLRTVTLRLASGQGCTTQDDPLALPIEVSMMTETNSSNERHVTLQRTNTTQALTSSYDEHRFTVPESPRLSVGAAGPAVVLVRAAQGAPSDCVRLGLTASTEEDSTSTIHWEIEDRFSRVNRPAYSGSYGQQSDGAILMSIAGDALSDDVSLSELRITESSGAVHRLDPGNQNPAQSSTTGFTYGLTLQPSTHTITVAATPSHHAARVSYLDHRAQGRADADPSQPGYQVRVSPGRTIIRLFSESASHNYGYSTITVRRPEAIACTAPDLNARHQLWASTVRPGTRTINREVSVHGFESDSSGYSSAHSFEIDGTSYRLRNIVHVAGGSVDGGLFLGIVPQIPTQVAQGLSIHVCEREFTLADARLLRSGNLYWANPSVDWTRPIERHLTLSRTTSDEDVNAIPKHATRIRVETGWTAFSCANASCADRDSRERTIVVSLEEDERYRVEIQGAVDKHAKLQKANGTSIASAYGPGQAPAIMEHTAASDGDVFIRMTGAARVRVVEASTPLGIDEVVGHYRTDCPDTAGKTDCVVQVSDPKTASIASSGDVDHFAVLLNEHKRYAISVSPYAVGGAPAGRLSAAQIALLVRGEDEALLESTSASADSEGIARIAHVRGEGEPSTWVWLRVSGRNKTTGTYVVSVREVSGSTVSVADATQREGADARMRFTVSVEPAAQSEITVGYRTIDGTARGGSDYTTSSGTLTIAAGATDATIDVPLIDDRHDEGPETFSIELASAAGATLGRSTATGTITNTDPVPKKWLARVGQSTARQIGEAVSDRMRSNRASARLVVGGHSMDPTGQAASMTEDAPQHTSPTLELEQALAGASFQWSDSSASGTRAPWTVWGRIAHTNGTSSAGEELDAQVRSALVGTDVELDDWIVGVAVAHTSASGGYEAGGREALDAAFTGVYPYAGLRTRSGGSVWASVGAGSGEFKIESEEDARARSDLTYRMASAGMRQPLGRDNRDTPQISLVADWAWSQMKTPGAPGEFARTSAHSNWARGQIRAEQRYELDDGAQLIPWVGVGVHHDFGDAETGTGIETEGSVKYVSGALSGEVGARALISDSKDEYREWSVDASLAYDATRGRNERGLYMSLTPRVSNQGLSTGRYDAWNIEELGTETAMSMDLDTRYGLMPGALGESVSVYSVMRFEPGTTSPTVGIGWALGAGSEMKLESTRTEGDTAVQARVQVRF